MEIPNSDNVLAQIYICSCFRVGRSARSTDLGDTRRKRMMKMNSVAPSF